MANKKRKRGQITKRPLLESTQLHKSEPEQLDIPQEYQQIFQRFQADVEVDMEEIPQALPTFLQGPGHQDSIENASEQEQEAPISVRKILKESRMSVADLKSLVDHPEVVEWFDVSAADPLFLVYLKSYRNTIPVPSHWQLKRKYLSNKHGNYKPPFELPHYIKETGVMEQRDALVESQRDQIAKQREKVRPKLNKMFIDYQQLYDAFFKYQTKPHLTMFGDVFHENKQFDTVVTNCRPGQISPALQEALGSVAPLPWLINMQRFGPPPSYPNLKIPGLNSPIPQGAKWGYQAGGYGKPPVDDNNQHLYGGDVFKQAAPVKLTETEKLLQLYKVPVVKQFWEAKTPNQASKEQFIVFQ